MKFILALAILAVGLSTTSLALPNEAPSLNLSTDPKLNDTCTTDAQCRLQSTICRSGRCQCQLGTLEYHKSICRPEYCEDDAICGQLFGPHTICDAGHRCVCNASSVLDHDTQRCLPAQVQESYTLLNETIKLSNGSTICPIGYLPTKSETLDCIRMPCVDDKDCTTIFGINTTCDTYFSKCGCDRDHAVDGETQKCSIQIHQQLNATCFSNFDCFIENSECVQGVCQCAFGYEAFRQDQCLLAFCAFEDTICQRKFGPNTVCEFNGCKCGPSFELDPVTRQCTKPTVTQLNGTCFDDDDCSTNAACVRGQCHCKMGYLRDGSSLYNCAPYTCSNDFECGLRFNTSSCRFGSCGCYWEAGYELETRTQQCKARSHRVGDSCWIDEDCGSNVNCVLGRCRCQSGYEAGKNGFDCNLASCTTDDDCEVLDINSRCQFSICTCQDGYITNWDLQVCQPIDDGYDYYMTSSVALFTIFGIISLCLGLIIISARNRAAAVAAASRPRVTATVNSSAKISLPQKS